MPGRMTSPDEPCRSFDLRLTSVMMYGYVLMRSSALVFVWELARSWVREVWQCANLSHGLSTPVTPQLQFARAQRS